MEILIKAKNAQNQKITADGLHLNPLMTSMIEQGKGIFVIGLKENQKTKLLN